MAADGLLIGGALLAGVVLGPPALALVPAVLLLLDTLRGRIWWSRVALALACAAIGALRGATVDNPVPVADLARSTGAIGVVDALPVAGGTNERTILRLEKLLLPNRESQEAAGRVVIFLPEGATVSLGDWVLVIWSATPVEALPPGFGGFVAGQGGAGSAHVFACEVLDEGPGWLRTLARFRRAIGSRLQEALPGDAGALAAGMVTGDDSGLSPETEAAFRRAGVSHITAVSGQNVSLLLGFSALWLRPSRRGARIAAHGAMILLVWLYAIMVGLEPPALRAALVATLTIVGAYTGRRPDPLTLLALALGGMVVVDPGMARGAGFWLSAAASCALCGAMPVAGPPGPVVALRRALAGVLAATVATLPVLLWVFGEWSPVGPLANLLITPLLTVTFPAAYLLAMVLLIAPPVGALVAWIPGIGLDATLAIVDRVSGVLPLLTLDLTGPAGLVVVGLPSAAIVFLLSRDGARWTRVAAHRWRTGRGALLSLAGGAAVGVAVALLVLTAVQAP